MSELKNSLRVSKSFMGANCVFERLFLVKLAQYFGYEAFDRNNFC